MDPTQPSPDPYPTSPFYSGPSPQPPVNGPDSEPQADFQPKKGKLLLILVVGSALELLVIISLIVVMASGGSKTPVPPAGNATGTSQNQTAETATPSGIQAINDSISQDISTLNDEQIFAPAKYEDKTLNL